MFRETNLIAGLDSATAPSTPGISFPSSGKREVCVAQDRSLSSPAGPLFPYLLNEGSDAQMVRAGSSDVICTELGMPTTLLIPGPCCLSPPGCVGAQHPMRVHLSCL